MVRVPGLFKVECDVINVECDVINIECVDYEKTSVLICGIRYLLFGSPYRLIFQVNMDWAISGNRVAGSVALPAFLSNRTAKLHLKILLHNISGLKSVKILLIIIRREALMYIME